MDLGRLLPMFTILIFALSRASIGQAVMIIGTCNNNICCQKQNYTEIDNSRRSVQSWKSGQDALCDKDLAPGWYRFTSFVGAAMPTTKVNSYRCGTKHPIWLNDVHPSLDAPVTHVQACINVRDRNRGCFFSFNIGVKHCPGGFYVYYLLPTQSCYSAYCAEVTTTAAITTSSSEDTTAPSTNEEKSTKPSTEEVSSERKTDFQVEISIKEEWDDRLKDKSSEKFKTLSTLLKDEILKAYPENSELKEVVIISMRPGSIIAEFRLTFKTRITGKEALAPLKKVMATGKLGRFEVDPNSLKLKLMINKQEASTEASTKESKSSKVNLPLTIGVSCGSVVVLAVLTICFVFYCKRSAVPARNNSRVGDSMAADEMQLTNSKVKKFVWIKENGVWNKGME